jgi:hypothetical protein
VRLPTGVGETGTLPAHWQLLILVVGWQGGMGMPRMCSCRLGANKLRGAAKTGEPPEGNETGNVVSTLPVLHVSWDMHVDMLLLCSVVVAHKNANGGEPVDEMLPCMVDGEL